jgi:hypothetical protein
MAAAPRTLFRPDELATDAEVEAIETQQEPTQQQPTQQEPAQPTTEQPPAPEAPQEPVPYVRFQQLNDTNKALEKELAEHREFRTRLDERQRLIQQANEQAQRQAEAQRYAAERPDPALDPIGAQLYDLQAERVNDRAEIQQLKGQLNQFGQNYQNGQEQAAFMGWVKDEANAYNAQDPHYIPAAKYCADRRVNFWRTVAPNAPAGLAERMVEAESVLIARLAQQYGGKFAPALAKLARDWGYQPQTNGAQANGSPRPPASPQAARLQQVQAGQRVQGLGAVPAAAGNADGTSAYRNYSPVDIANMSEREFMAAMANPATARDLRYAMARAEGFDNGEANF